MKLEYNKANRAALAATTLGMMTTEDTRDFALECIRMAYEDSEELFHSDAEFFEPVDLIGEKACE